MPVATCKCGRLTNSATSDFWEQYRLGISLDEVRPTRCYARRENGKWIKGCAFDEASEFDQKFALDIIWRGSGK